MSTEKDIMQIIINGGDARANCIKAIREARVGNWEEVDALMKKAKDSLNEAHLVQTKLIQAEVRGEHTTVSLLMVHAQDHLMNAITVKDLAIELIKECEKRIELENLLKERI